MGNVTGIIKNVIGVLVVMAAIAVTWPIQMIAVDGFYKKFVNHCAKDGVEYTRLYKRVADTEDLDLSGYVQFTFNSTTLADTNCSGKVRLEESSKGTPTGAGNDYGVVVGTLGTIAATDKWYSEHNQLVPTTTAAKNDSGTNGVHGYVEIAGAKLKKPMAILTPYASISTVILGAIPVLSSVTFIGAAGFNLYREQGSSEGIVSTQVLYTIGALIAVIVVLFGMPILLGFFNIAYVASGGANIATGPWEATRQFGSIISIVFEMSPILAVLSSMTGFALLGYKHVRASGMMGQM